MKVKTGDALIVVDAQRDFISGTLAVPGAELALVHMNDLIQRFVGRALPVAYTGDLHPADHCSFATQGGTWPAHCVRDTRGADILAIMAPLAVGKVFYKGRLRDTEEYSGFDNSELDDWLRVQGTQRVFVCGLALDYCVRATALSAIDRGYEVVLVVDATAAVSETTRDAASQELIEEGVRFRTARWVET